LHAGCDRRVHHGRAAGIQAGILQMDMGVEHG
jgi:hypothetical protein